MKAIDETGNVYGSLTVLQFARSKSGKHTWLCECACGRETVVHASNLRSGHTKSCGCENAKAGLAKRHDLEGKVFGWWTVIEFAEHKGRTLYWRCVCVCGNEKLVCTQSLTRGDSESCGCRRSRNTLDDLTGQTFGRLSVLGRAPSSKAPCGTVMTKWRCQCACGNVKAIDAGALKSGATLSCGCYHKEVTSLHLEGLKFGRLTVIKQTRTSEIGGHRYWFCKCECGNEHEASGSKLVCGDIKSCGCISAVRGGLSQTNFWKTYYARIRRDRAIVADVLWTPALEVALVAFQPDCVLCGKPATSTDHVRPLLKGYGLKPGNAVRLCLSCNSKKSSKDLDELPPDVRDKLLAAAFDFDLHCLFEPDLVAA